MSWRTIYVYESRLFRSHYAEEMTPLVWDPGFVENVFDHIYALPQEARVLDREGEWFFFLHELRKTTSNKVTFLYGYFNAVRLGVRTDLQARSTLQTRKNPKAEDESETRKTFFLLRLSDGLLLLDSYANNVVTNKRLTEYLKLTALEVFKTSDIAGISFNNLMDTGFLEDLEKFDMIRLARVRLSLKSSNYASESDAIELCKEMAVPTNANYMELVVGKKHAKKHGLSFDHLKAWLIRLMRDKQDVIGGVIEGTRSDGGSPTLKLNGIEEKHREEFDTDELGEVLQEQMFDYMINLAKISRTLG